MMYLGLYSKPKAVVNLEPKLTGPKKKKKEEEEEVINFPMCVAC